MIKRTRRLCLQAVLGLTLGLLPARAEEPQKPEPVRPTPAAETVGSSAASKAPAAPSSKSDTAKKGESAQEAVKRQSAEAARLEKLANSLGMDCEAPVFSFRRLTPRTFLLFVKAKKEGDFKIRIFALSDDSLSNPRELVTLHDSIIRAVPDPGKPVDVFFKSLGPVFAKGGRVRVVYESKDDGEVCADRMKGDQVVTVLPEHQLDIDAGWIYNLEKDGHWDPSGYFGFAALSHLYQHLSGLASFHFARVGIIDSAADTASAASKFSNPFQSRAGSLTLNLAAEISPELPRLWKKKKDNPVWLYPGFITLGTGFTTAPGDLTEPKARFFAGVGLRVDDYNVNGSTMDMPNTTGCIRLLYAYDKLYEWEDSLASVGKSRHSDFHRFIIEGELEIPGIGSADFKPAVRGFIDVPLHGLPLLSGVKPEATNNGLKTAGPSRVSVSLVAHVDVHVLEKIFSVP